MLSHVMGLVFGVVLNLFELLHALFWPTTSLAFGYECSVIREWSSTVFFHLGSSMQQ